MSTISTKKLLKNYLHDMEYQLDADGVDSGVNFINNNTNGTPYFQNRDEAVEYIDQLKSVIEGIDK